MNSTTNFTNVDISELKHFKLEYLNNEYVVTLVDSENYSILKGYGRSIVEAINDLHHNLL